MVITIWEDAEVAHLKVEHEGFSHDHDNDARASHLKMKYNVLYLLILEPGDFSGKKAKEVVPW